MHSVCHVRTGPQGRGEKNKGVNDADRHRRWLATKGKRARRASFETAAGHTDWHGSGVPLSIQFLRFPTRFDGSGLTAMKPTDHERRIQTICLLVLTAVALGAALYFLSPVLIPFVLAAFLVLALGPFIDLQMRRLRIGRAFAIINTALLGLIGLILIGLVIQSAAAEMSRSAGEYQAQLSRIISDAAAKLPLERLGIEPDQLKKLTDLPQDSISSIVTNLIGSVVSIVSNGLLVIIFMLFMMAGAGKIPPPSSLRGQIERQIKRYMMTKVFASGLTGFLVGLTFVILGVRMALVFGLLAFLLNFIPNVGSVAATLLPLPIVVLSPDLSTFAKVMAFLIPAAIQMVIGNIVEPRLQGRSLDLHPVAVLLGLIFFGMIWGVIGMLLATPIVAMLKIVLERIELTAPVAELLAGRPMSAPLLDGPDPTAAGPVESPVAHGGSPLPASPAPSHANPAPPKAPTNEGEGGRPKPNE